MKKIISLLSVFIAALFCVFSEADERLLSKINFSGNKRTQNFYLQLRVKKYINQKICDIDLTELEGVLQAEGIFEDIQIEVNDPSESEAQINISLKEKITFLPLPFAMYSNGKVTAGLVAIDMNFLGIKDMGMLGGIYNSNYYMGMFSYVHTPKSMTHPGFRFFIGASKDNNEYTDSLGEVRLPFDGSSFGVKAAFIQKLPSNYSAYAGIDYSYHGIKDKDKKPFLSTYEIVDEDVFNIDFGIDYSSSSWNGTFLSGASASLGCKVGFRDDGKTGKNYSFRFSKQLPVTEKVRLFTGGGLSYSDNCNFADWGGKGSCGVSILPNEFKTPQIAGAVAGVEWAFAKTKIGMFSIYGNGEVVTAKDEFGVYDDDYLLYYGVSSGMRIYLSKIAFPALASGWSYNIAEKKWFFSASLGASF